jgi:7-cyano-7-deazaguanine synthase
LVRAVALISGGLDSTIATWAANDEHEVVLGLTFDYGQRAAQREIAAAGAVCARLACEHEVVELPWLGRLGKTALTDLTLTLPEPSPELLDDPAGSAETARAVWTPNRNGVFISIAAAYCEGLGCERIVVGFNVEEAATFPDNSREFLDATNRALAFSTRTGVCVVAPTAEMTKVEIVRLGLRLGAPLDLVWACYEGGRGHCLRCESCLRLRRALEAAGVWDEWRANSDGGR